MRRLAFLAVTLAMGTARAHPAPATWSAFRAPTPGPAQSVGGYSAGCLLGAIALPAKGTGFAIARPERRRLFGHPALVAFIRDLGRRVTDKNLPRLSVGDLGQARGGPAPTGHASHQNGLDVDIWFLPPDGDATVSMVDAKTQRPSPRFDEAVVSLLELAAADARVDRIFVHPILKRSLCERSQGERGWLHKLTPWWGHDDHFHVRLACPADSPACVAQPPLPPGDGCDTLAWWFDEKADADRATARKRYAARVGAAPKLPAACEALVAP